MSQKSGGFRRAQPPADEYPQTGSIGMARSYYSTIFEQSADEIWNVIRDFNNYPVWVDGAGESEIEAGKPGDAVCAVRNVLYQGKRIRQKLLAMSDVERS
jgi:Polyketide cyclase / dehydrase and lipid transport